MAVGDSSIAIDGTDCVDIGVVIFNIIGWRDAIERGHDFQAVPGRADLIDMAGGQKIPQVRRIRATGYIKAPDQDTLVTRLRTLEDRVMDPAGEITVSFPDEGDGTITGINIRCKGRGTRVRAGRLGRSPYFATPAAPVTIEVTCADPRKYDYTGGAPGVVI